MQMKIPHAMHRLQEWQAAAAWVADKDADFLLAAWAFVCYGEQQSGNLLALAQAGNSHAVALLNCAVDERHTLFDKQLLHYLHSPTAAFLAGIDVDFGSRRSETRLRYAVAHKFWPAAPAYIKFPTCEANSLIWVIG